MKAEIKTEVLKELLAKAVKGAGENKLIPITSLMELQFRREDLRITTTDMVHFLQVCGDLESCEEPWSIVAEVDRVAKLISKTTTDKVTIEDCGNYIEITGNGKYTIDIPLDENGERISYPTVETEITNNIVTNRTVLDLVYKSCKSSVAKTLEVPVYTNYYVGDIVLATDTYSISSVGISLLDGNNVLIPQELMELLMLIDEEKVDVSLCKNNYARFSAPNIEIIGKLSGDMSEYAVNEITELVNQEFDSTCAFSVTNMVNALERIALFVGPYDDGAIKLTFTEQGISIESKKSNGVEVIPYTDSENYTAFTCTINITMLLAQLKAISADKVTMQYGAENSVKLIDGSVTQVIALLE